MPGHLRHDPDSQPTSIVDPHWLRISAALTQRVAVLADRDDLLVAATPGAGHGAPGCFLPAMSTIEIDGRILGHNPTHIDPAKPGDPDRYPAAWGVLVHEAGHARHTAWQPPDGHDRAQLTAAKLLEEARVEARQLSRRPTDRRWLRAATTELILDDTPDQLNPWAAAHAAALVLARVDAGVLDVDEAAPLTEAAEDSLGGDLLAALRQVWRTAQQTDDHDGHAMLDLGAYWCELLGVDPDENEAVDVTTPSTAAAASNDPPGTSPITIAVKAALAAVAATDAEDAELTRAAPAIRADRAAAKADETAHRATARTTAATVFGRGAHTPTSAANAGWNIRPPTSTERAAARGLARRLRSAAHRERAATTVTSPVPPGRLHVRAALAADAQRAAGLRPTAEPWVRTTRRHVPSPPLHVGIAGDVSGSMQAAAAPLASTAWILAQATAWANGSAATVAFGENVTAVTRPGEVPGHVREFHAHDTTHRFCSAVDALDAALALHRPGHAARLLIIVSDGRYEDTERNHGQARVRRLLARGCAVVWLALNANTLEPMDGPRTVIIDDPTTATHTIAAAAQQALRQ